MLFDEKASQLEGVKGIGLEGRNRVLFRNNENVWSCVNGGSKKIHVKTCNIKEVMDNHNSH